MDVMRDHVNRVVRRTGSEKQVRMKETRESCEACDATRSRFVAALFASSMSLQSAPVSPVESL